MTKTRAQKGGEIGINGEHYDGGQFLPSSSHTIKGQNTSKTEKESKPRKQEIAPYKWEISDRQSIWTIVSPWCQFHKTGYAKETGSQGRLEVISGGYDGNQWEENQKLADRWNEGERWI